MKLRFALPAVAASAMLLLTGCVTSDSTGTTTDAATGTNAPSPSSSSATSAAETTSEPAPPPAPVNPKFGETHTWDDGLQVTFSVPVPFEPGEYSAIDGAAAHVSFDVKIVNAGTANYDPALFFTTMQSGNVEAAQVFDFENGYMPISTPVLPGREAVFKIGFGVADPTDLVMQVTPGFDYEAVIFTS